MLPMLKEAASVPPNVYVKSSLSGSVAETAFPMFTPEPVFSATDRVVLALANTGDRFSSTSVTLIVTVMLSDSFPSDAVTVTE